MKRYRIKSPRDMWLRRATIFVSAPLILAGLSTLGWMVVTQNYMMLTTHLAAFAAALVLGTPVAARLCVKKLDHADQAGPFGFDTVFKHVTFSIIWIGVATVTIYVLGVAVAVADFSSEGLYLGLVTFILWFLAGLFVAPFLGVPLALIIATLFRLIALESVHEKSDKSSCEEPV